MAAATNNREGLVIIHNVADIEANELKDSINAIRPNFCFSIDQFIGKRKSPAINNAISSARYFLIFLSRQLLSKEDLLWVDTTLQLEDIERKLAIVLHGMTMEEFRFLPNENLKRFDNRVIIKPNTINNSKNVWKKVAGDVIAMLLGSSGTPTNGSSTEITITPQPDSIPGRDQRVFIYHENLDLNIAKKIKGIIPEDYYVMWRGRHFVIGKPISWNIKKFLQSCRKTFVILNNDYKNILERFRQAVDIGGVHPSRITFILLHNVNISNTEDFSYVEFFGTPIRLDPDAIMTDAIQQDLKAAIREASVIKSDATLETM